MLGQLDCIHGILTVHLFIMNTCQSQCTAVHPYIHESESLKWQTVPTFNV